MSAENQKTILLVDDEAIIAMSEKMALEKYGYRVDLAHSGEEAVAIMEKSPAIDLILMDINLGPGIDGTEAAAAILERRDLPVVFLSSHMEPKIVEKTEKITSYGYVVKNSSITVLDASIKMAFKLFEAKIKEKEKEAALLESEEKFRLISGLSPVGIYLTDPQGECIYINDSWSKMAGMTLEEALGQGWINGIHPEDRQAVFANWEKMVASKGEWGKEYRFQDKNGKTTWVYGVAAPQRDSAGNIIRYIGVNVAISERKQAEEELQKRNQFIESILDKMPIGFAVNSTADGVARYMNGNFTKIYGWPKEVLTDIDRFFASVYPGPEGQELKARVIADMGSSDPKRMAWDDLRITTGTGEHRYISARNIPIPEQNLMVSTVWDTTQAHEAQQALRDAEARYRLLFDQSPDGIVVIDPATARILEFNRKAHEQLGYSREEFAGLSIPDIEAVETADETRARIARVMSDGPESFETRQRTRQGEIRDIQVTAQISQVQGRPIYHCIWRDITELKRAESGREEALATLKASEARAQALLRTIPDLLFRIDRQGVFLDYRADSKDLYVQSGPSLIGQRLRDIVPAPFADLIDRKTRATLESGALQTFEYRLPVPGRGERDYEARMVASGADEVTAIVRDITESKQLESQKEAAVAAQRESEKRLRDIIFSMADWVWEVDENGVYTYSSDKGRELFGSSRGDIIGKTPFDFMPAAEARRVGAIFSEITANKRPINDLENWNIGKNGELICLLTNGVPILDEKGNLKGYRGVDKNITERKQAEEALRKSEAIQSNALQMTKSGHWEYDVDSDLFTFNDNFYRIFRTTAAAAGGYRMSSGDYARRFCHPDDMAMVGIETRGAIESPDPNYSRQIEHRILYADGEVGYIAVRFFIVKDSRGRTVKTYGVNQDISERKRAEEEIKRQLAEKEILLKEVHHRIKNNIASIAGLISLRLQSIRNPEAASVLREAAGRIDSMRLLYDKLLLSADYKEISVKNYVENLIDTIVAMFPDKARIKVDKRIDDFPLESKRLFSLGLIVNELLTNKMKYAFVNRKTGLIKVTLTSIDNHVSLAIQDNGACLPDGFDVNESKGFGLMLVKMLSQQLGGSFSIKRKEGTLCLVEFDI